MLNSEESHQRSPKTTMQQASVKAWTGQPYPAYKDSGVEWLGKVPEHWDVLPSHACFQEKLREPNAGLREKTVLSLSYGRIVIKPPEKLHGLVPSSFETYQIVDPLDIVVRPTDLQNDQQSLRFGLSMYRGIISSAYMCLRANSYLMPEYTYLLLHAYDLKKIFYGLGSGLRQNLSWEDFKYLPCCVPTLNEQHAISHFLDDANERIQRYIHAKEKLIKLLEEQKRVIIHQAVTGQIDVRTGKPYPAYKDSGVDWLGEVPEHWEVDTVKRGYDIKLGKMLQTKPNDANDIEVPYLKAKDVQWFSVQPISGARMWASPGDIEQFSVSGGDLLVCEGGEGGRCGILADQVSGYIIQNSLHRVRSHYGNSNTFLQYTMRAVADTGWFVAINNKATIAHFTYEKFGALRVPLPSSSEQTAIARFLTDTCQRISAACAAVKREIELLHEYRTRLIADVVTGKLDVREAAAALPEKEPPTGGDNCQDGMAFAVQVQSRCP